MSDMVPTEIVLLAAATAVGFAQLCWAAVAARRQQGLGWAAGPRDKDRPATDVAARLERAFRNFMETYAFFAVSVLAAAVAGKFGTLTLWGAVLYVAGRVVYVPLYAFGIRYWRTLAWFVAIVGIVLVFAALFV